MAYSSVKYSRVLVVDSPSMVPTYFEQLLWVVANTTGRNHQKAGHRTTQILCHPCIADEEDTPEAGIVLENKSVYRPSLT